LLDRVSLLEIDIMISEGYDFQDWSSLLSTKRTYLRADYTRDPIDWAVLADDRRDLRDKYHSIWAELGMEGCLVHLTRVAERASEDDVTSPSAAVVPLPLVPLPLGDTSPSSAVVPLAPEDTSSSSAVVLLARGDISSSSAVAPLAIAADIHQAAPVTPCSPCSPISPTILEDSAEQVADSAAQVALAAQGFEYLSYEFNSFIP
jgi:hypothetical protein